MLKYFPSWEVTAIDISSKSIDIARNRNLPGIRFDVYNGTHIPEKDQYFDIIFMAGVLHHVDFSLHESLLAECCRVLCKAGRLYLFEHNPLNPLTRHLVNTCVFDKDARLLNNRYARKLIQQTGLLITHNRFLIFFPRKGLLSRFIPLEKKLEWLPLGGQYLIRSEKI
jgi:ubiquinone/menaquinone biosynthesis C-methylase UbiE